MILQPFLTLYYVGNRGPQYDRRPQGAGIGRRCQDDRRLPRRHQGRRVAQSTIAAGMVNWIDGRRCGYADSMALKLSVF